MLGKRTNMGMYAEVIAVGPFKKALVPHLEYPPDVYSTFSGGRRADNEDRDLAAEQALGAAREATAS